MTPGAGCERSTTGLHRSTKQHGVATVYDRAAYNSSTVVSVAVHHSTSSQVLVTPQRGATQCILL